MLRTDAHASSARLWSSSGCSAAVRLPLALRFCSASHSGEWRFLLIRERWRVRLFMLRNDRVEKHGDSCQGNQHDNCLGIVTNASWITTSAGRLGDNFWCAAVPAVKRDRIDRRSAGPAVTSSTILSHKAIKAPPPPHPVQYELPHPPGGNSCWILQSWPWKMEPSSRAGVLVRPPNAPAK